MVVQKYDKVQGIFATSGGFHNLNVLFHPRFTISDHETLNLISFSHSYV